ncbi:hypothetical protein QP027_02920 [Corynebacterium breve]|uniref:Uncharacterized protein n=1 Tax=Corynebacterium breve TaxID=3049799 RepID=A0ABY8VFE8_9CORY|nr:hypothetical protein [Corynebacterium breve]WIM68364.1 hypothetical protein QP027_02920 [Corynebacterium breve]
MRVDAIVIEQIEGDTLYFRAADKETGDDRVAQLRTAIEDDEAFVAEDLDGREQSIEPSNIKEWTEQRIEDSAVTD